jgi:hypothetical protein
VDGLNVVEREADDRGRRDQVDPRASPDGRHPGWQVSGQTSRRFFFTETGRSYAKWIGDTRNVGVIEAGLLPGKDPADRAAAVAPAPALEESRDSAEQSRGRRLRGEAGAAENKSRAETRPDPPPPPRESDSFAATGIGERTDFPGAVGELRGRPGSRGLDCARATSTAGS